MNSAIDVNNNPTITARLNTDGITVERITANPTTGAVMVNNHTTGTAVAHEFAATDDNGRTTMFAVSSVDRTSLIALQADSTGALLINSH